MNRKELTDLMSPQMKRSFYNAEREALAEVYRENYRMNGIIEDAQKEWSKANAKLWSDIDTEWRTKEQIIDAQIKALQELRREAFETREAKRSEVYAQQAKDLKPVWDSLEADRNANIERHDRVQADVLAKYEAKLNAKVSA